MRGHEEASGTAYVPKALMDEWASKDPIDRFEAQLKEQGVGDEKLLRQDERRFEKRLTKQSTTFSPVEHPVETLIPNSRMFSLPKPKRLTSQVPIALLPTVDLRRYAMSTPFKMLSRPG